MRTTTLVQKRKEKKHTKNKNHVDHKSPKVLENNSLGMPCSITLLGTLPAHVSYLVMGFATFQW
jgi:hypothetical protein